MDAMKANEVREIAVNAAKDYVKGRIAKGKDGSPSVGLVHAGLLVHVMNEVRSTIDDAEPEEVINESLFIAFAEVESVKEFGARMVGFGVGKWWRMGMGYIGED